MVGAAGFESHANVKKHPIAVKLVLLLFCRLPWSRDQVWRAYQKAGIKAGIGGLGTHSLRHTFRAWLDSVGTSVAVQQKLMRHASIVTTMDHCGDVISDEMTVASGKVTRLALNGADAARKAS